VSNEAQLALIHRLHVSDTIKEAIPVAAELLAATSGAAVGILLAAERTLGAEHWHGASPALRERVRPLLSAHLAGHPGAIAPDDLQLHILPLSSAGRRLGLVGLVLDAGSSLVPEALERARGVAESLARRLDRDRQRAEMQAELDRYRRWYATVDSQMQILDRERQKFAALVNQSDTPIFVADAEHVARWENTALRERIGERVVGLGVQQIWDLLGVALPSGAEPACPVSRAFRERSVVHQECRQVRDGETRNLYLTALPIRDKEGHVAEVLVMIQDLSDLEILRRSESRYRLLFERSPDAMIMASPDLRQILLSNHAAWGLTGHTATELSALTVEALHEPEDWPAAREAYARIGAAEAAERTERRLRTKQGRALVANVTASRFDLDDRPVTLLVLQDVTRQRQLEAELRQAQESNVRIGRAGAPRDPRG